MMVPDGEGGYYDNGETAPPIDTAPGDYSTWSPGQDVTPVGDANGNDIFVKTPSNTDLTNNGGAHQGTTPDTSTGGVTADDWLTKIGKGLGLIDANGNIDYKKLLAGGAGVAAFYDALNKPAYKSKTAAELLAMQPSNTPGAFSADQMAKWSTPMLAGNQITRVSAKPSDLPIVAGNTYGKPAPASSAFTAPISAIIGTGSAAPGSPAGVANNSGLDWADSAKANEMSVGKLLQALKTPATGYSGVDLSGNPLAQAFAKGGPVAGPLTQTAGFVGIVPGGSGGQSDLFDAKLSGGEYVVDAESVAMLGDGDNAAGAQRLDELRQQLRQQKRSAPDDEIAPPAQGPLSYMGAAQ